MNFAVNWAENILATEDRSSGLNILFSNPCKQAEIEYVLHHHSKLPKALSRCQEKYGKPINKNDILLVTPKRKTY